MRKKNHNYIILAYSIIICLFKYNRYIYNNGKNIYHFNIFLFYLIHLYFLHVYNLKIIDKYGLDAKLLLLICLIDDVHINNVNPLKIQLLSHEVTLLAKTPQFPLQMYQSN